MVDVSHFEPNEISVKTTDTDIIVNGMMEFNHCNCASVLMNSTWICCVYSQARRTQGSIWKCYSGVCSFAFVAKVYYKSLTVIHVAGFRFRRRVTIPKGVNHETVTSTMSPEGILTIMAPKMMLKGEEYCKRAGHNWTLISCSLILGSNERVIPITLVPSAGSSNVPTPNPGN